MVLIEAVALGTKVVSTDCPSGPSEILSAGEHGRLVPVGDDDALAEALIDSLTEPRIESDSEWIKKFTSDYCCQQFMEILQLN